MRHKSKKNLFQRGATTIMLASFVMVIILMIAASAAAIMAYQIKMSREIANSIPAFYAADAAAEKCLYETRKLGEGEGNCTVIGGAITMTLTNGAVGLATRTAENQIKATGEFGQTLRNVQLDW
jgi:hypothetical protein